ARHVGEFFRAVSANPACPWSAEESGQQCGHQRFWTYCLERKLPPWLQLHGPCKSGGSTVLDRSRNRARRTWREGQLRDSGRGQVGRPIQAMGIASDQPEPGLSND